MIRVYINKYIRGGIRCGGLTPACGSAHARSGKRRTGMRAEAVSATLLARSALNTTVMSEEKENANIAIRHQAQKCISRS